MPWELVLAHTRPSLACTLDGETHTLKPRWLPHINFLL
jgi:hypothetical protein